jgi:hypothetical protein
VVNQGFVNENLEGLRNGMKAHVLDSDEGISR